MRWLRGLGRCYTAAAATTRAHLQPGPGVSIQLRQRQLLDYLAAVVRLRLLGRPASLLLLAPLLLLSKLRHEQSFVKQRCCAPWPAGLLLGEAGGGSRRLLACHPWWQPGVSHCWPCCRLGAGLLQASLRQQHRAVGCLRHCQQWSAVHCWSGHHHRSGHRPLRLCCCCRRKLSRHGALRFLLLLCLLLFLVRSNCSKLLAHSVHCGAQRVRRTQRERRRVGDAARPTPCRLLCPHGR